jgi:hypothetical protein
MCSDMKYMSLHYRIKEVIITYTEIKKICNIYFVLYTLTGFNFYASNQTYLVGHINFLKKILWTFICR